MDCRWALEILESSRPDSADWQESELEEAAAHVEHCESCEETFRARQALDRRIGSVMRDVAVPGDLLGRITASLAPMGQSEKSTVALASSTASSTTAPTSADEMKETAPKGVPEHQKAKPISRRRWLRTTAATLAACALAVSAWLIFRPAAPTLTLDEIGQTAPFDLTSLDSFDNNFEAIIPSGWESDSLQFARQFKGFGRNRRDADQVALIEFHFQGWDGTPHSGVLAITPRADVFGAENLPSSFWSAMGAPLYVKPGYTTVAWASDELVYVCFVPAEGNAQEQLQEVLKHEAA